MRVPEQHGAPRADEIDQFVAVGIVNVRALPTFHDERFAADGAKGAHGAIDAADEDLLRLAKDFR
ncbi:MAG: hypothetical protein NVS9B14_18050 [Candidatus Acidiferrum sp.]